MLEKIREESVTRLSDGVLVDSLIDRERCEVSQRVYTDPQIYQLELDRIWSKAWVVLGHESEIPNPGDFVTRRIADDPVVLTRARNNEIKCLLNVCPHRGATVCKAEAGNAPALRCIYHGWIFNLDGTFRGAPFINDYFPNGLDKERVGLRSARVSVFAGLIFANWDENAPPLEEYLGDFRSYLSLIFDLTKQGFEVLGPPQRFVINANWKTASEQFAGDAYHANQVHRSLATLANIVNVNDPHEWQLFAPKVGTKNGHNTLHFDMRKMFSMMSGGKELTAIEKLTMVPPPGVPRDMVPELVEKLSPETLQFLADMPPSTGGMFPNVGLWNTTGLLADRSLAGFKSFRTFIPLGVDKFEFCMWTLVARGAPQELREQIRRNSSTSQGAAGFIESDDAEVWPGMSAEKGPAVWDNTLKYWSLAGPNRPEGWQGQGDVYSGFSRDDPQWNWWKVYFEYLKGEELPQ